MIPEPFTLERPVVDWTRHGRTQAPKILPPPGEVWRTPGGRKQAGRYYTRTSTLAKALEDAHALYGWKVRRALVGVGQRHDYWMRAASLTAEDHDREALEELAEACIEASGPSAALIGTTLHTYTERVDRGEPLGYVPDELRELIEAWQRITAPLRLEYREVRTVHDGLGAAGTPDAYGFCSLPDPDGVVDDRRVIDLKSGSIKYPATMSGQLFVYADSDLYDPETGERRPLEVNTRWGLIVHLKSDSSEPPGLYWLNLEHGRRCVELARPVREWRAVKADAILLPALVEERVPATPAADAGLVDITEAVKVASERVEPSGFYTYDENGRRVVELEAAPVRCDLSDLLVSECGCRVHRPDVRTTAGGELVEDDGPADITDRAHRQDIARQAVDPIDAPGPHRFAVGKTLYGVDLCATCGLVREDNRRGQHIVGAIGSALELDDPEPPPATVAQHCRECVASEHDDPAPWCDCRADETHDGITPCRRRAHAPADCPALRIAAAITDRDLDLLWSTEGRLWNAEHRALSGDRMRELRERRELDRPRAALLAAIATAPSVLELRALWFEHGAGPGSLWTDEHTAASTRRHAELAEANVA